MGRSFELGGENVVLAPNDAENPGETPAPRTVSLALTPLPVTASSATSATATLPTMLDAGTYLLTLSRSDGEMAVFFLTTGAVGRQGSPGEAGPPGVAGRTGMPAGTPCGAMRPVFAILPLVGLRQRPIGMAPAPPRSGSKPWPTTPSSGLTPESIT